MVAPTRRSALLQLSGLGLGLLPLPSWAATPTAEPIVFTAYRNGSLFGYHKVAFAGNGARLTVDIEIAFDYKLAFIPLYHYRHKNQEIWDDGRLIKLNTETDDNGTSYRVEATSDNDRLLVDGSGGRLSLSPDTPTTSYWNERTVERGEWLDTQNGKLVRSSVSPKGPDPIEVGGRQVKAMAYDLDGDITCTLWYLDGRWVKLRFLASDKSVIEYAIDAPGQSG